MKLTIRKANEEFVVALPDETVARLGWGAGDVLAAEVIGDALRLVRIETKHDRAMRIADEMMEEYRTTFEQLAKS
jgi:bifunctional DNA-binding transcriptional regulator/antitoxin component of YhaV-PrlF toxin-antitoxin module